MISAGQNELMTRIGPGTPAGKLLRRYWQPVALVDEMKGERPVKAVRLFAEDLVLYKAGNAYALMQRHCPHRGADLAYGRLEADGLRCSFHGWKFDAAGKCMETPAEPEGSRLCEHIKTVSYPVVEKSGILFAYLGEGAAPAFPHFDCFVAPDAYTFAFKGYWDCNWLQALEVGIDPAHASWLHKYFEDEDTAGSYGKQFRGQPADSEMPISKVLREYDRPEIRVERTEYGMRLQTLRRISDAQTHIRVTNILFPQAFVIPMNAEMTITQFHVPVDDTGCYWYSIFTSFAGAVDKDTMRSQRLRTYPAPDYKPIFSRQNGWGFSAQEQKSQTFTGMGFDINIHDQFACESQGPIADRTKENLGSTDKGIVLYRRILLDLIKKNEAGDLVVKADFSGPPTIDGIGPTSGIDDYWKTADEKRRKQSPWGGENPPKSRAA
jgi:phenylpropionate dioxygenase-like ring-hydroxylating dioxygenase large terminal subunit